MSAAGVYQPILAFPESQRPRLDICLTEQRAWLVPHNSPDPDEGIVDIVKQSNPTHAYKILPSKEKVTLDHHAPGWGFVAFGIILPRLADGVFQMPTPESAQLVAIKRLNKRVVDAALHAGIREDPYKELYRMQTLGDDVHVLGCIEALQDEDEKYMYIIMPYCSETLVDKIPWNQGFPEEQVRYFFAQILENLLYLRQHGICHRDLSPDNCMIYKGRVVFNDLAMSFEIPPDVRAVGPMGFFGKPAYLSPEVWGNLDSLAYACDIWSAAVILFNLLTGEILYRLPMPSDIQFRYFIMARGIAQTLRNELTVEILSDLEGGEESGIWKIASRCLEMSPDVQQVLDAVLRLAPEERWKVDDVIISPFIGAQ